MGLGPTKLDENRTGADSVFWRLRLFRGPTDRPRTLVAHQTCSSRSAVLSWIALPNTQRRRRQYRPRLSGRVRQRQLVLQDRCFVFIYVVASVVGTRVAQGRKYDCHGWRRPVRRFFRAGKVPDRKSRSALAPLRVRPHGFLGGAAIGFQVGGGQGHHQDTKTPRKAWL
jgi:hypothetical protein